MSEFRDYTFIDGDRLDMYFEQLGVPPKRQGQRKVESSISMLGPQVKVLVDQLIEARKDHDKIDALIEYLRDKDLMDAHRPNVMSRARGTERPFVFELDMQATKVILPKERLQDVIGLKELAVWISDPLEIEEDPAPFSYVGTFLYLTESFWDDGAFSTVYSGCSALQVIVNTALGEPLLRRNQEEPMGRGSFLHPVAKLESIGGIVTDKRRISSLYRKRYMTNEQCCVVGGQERRVNDLLGYPIFIAAL